MGYGDTFHFYGYTSDNTSTYAIKMSAADAALNGATQVAAPPLTPPWPWHYRDLRHVTGFYTSAGVIKRSRLVVTDPTNAKYVSGSGYTDSHANAVTVEGAIGERRPSNHLK